MQAAWTDYAAAWTAVTTNPAIGNGTIDASYHRIGKTVHFVVKVTMGSTTTLGSGQWRISLPFTAAQTRWRAQLDMQCAASPYGWTAVATSSTVLGLTAAPTTAGNSDRSVSSTVPGTWTTGDTFTITGTYETT
jgi:hypothetical protein